MSKAESQMRTLSIFVAVAVATCAAVTGGMWLAERPDVQKNGASAALNPVRWMFWAAGRDMDEQLKHPQPVMPVGKPLFEDPKFGEAARQILEHQRQEREKFDEIRRMWNPSSPPQFPR